MSLTGWLTDYVFVPLNIKFRDMALWGTCLAAVINLVLVGFWHGANWTYGLFGLYHGLLFVPLVLSGSFGKNKKLKANEKGLPFGKDFMKMIGTYCLVAIGLVIFRAPSVSEAFGYFGGIFDASILSAPQHIGGKIVIAIALGLLLLALEWKQRDKEYSSQLKATRHWSQYLLDLVLIAAIVLVGSFGGNQFIYFQF